MSTTTSGSKKVIILRSNDNETFEVEEAVAMVSQTIKNMIEDVSGDDLLIPLPNVDGKTLSRVIEYCTKHSRATTTTTDHGDGDALDNLSEFDSEFVKGTADWDVLFDLILAANYLNIKGLLDLTCQAAADRLKDETCMEKVRAIFNIDNDYTPEEDKELREKNSWAFIL